MTLRQEIQQYVYSMERDEEDCHRPGPYGAICPQCIERRRFIRRLNEILADHAGEDTPALSSDTAEFPVSCDQQQAIYRQFLIAGTRLVVGG